MNLRSITFDENEEPTELVFSMSTIEANAILGVFGQLNGHAHRRLRFGPTDDVYEGVSSAFVKLFDDGVLFKVPPLSGINDAEAAS